MSQTNNVNELEHVKRTIAASHEARQDFWNTHTDAVMKAAQWMGETVRNDGKILIFGNGGSAADAQHMAAEMVGRMLVERKRPLPAVALTTDTSALTAIGNDYSYEDIFRLQVEALGRKGDLIIAISTSGNSKNVVRAVESAKKNGLRVVTMTGGSGGKLKELGDLSLNVSLGKNSSMIQETHITIVHLLVDLMDRFHLTSDYVKT
ncbi:MAG: SIS domain-containing protein [Deltaproteobacteria bacterium]|nr:SIS domain-containing protein [Deltaproteobacteria bacterium]